MKKGYQGDELCTAVNSLTGKWELVDPEYELIPGETILKLYYCKRLWPPNPECQSKVVLYYAHLSSKCVGFC